MMQWPPVFFLALDSGAAISTYQEELPVWDYFLYLYYRLVHSPKYFYYIFQRPTMIEF